MTPEPVAVARHVVIVGAGPAGVECALTAAGRGHRVTLVERRDHIGGWLAVLRHVSRQARFGDWIEDAGRRLAASSVELRLSCEGGEALFAELGPDVVVNAGGAVRRAGIGIDVDAALAGGTKLGRRVAVVGGLDDHLPPLIVADHLAGLGHAVVLLTELASPGVAVESASLYALMRSLHARGVEIVPFTAASGFAGGRVATRDTLTNATGELAGIDSVVDVDTRISSPAIGGAAHVIGDALSPRRMLHATLDGARLGLQL